MKTESIHAFTPDPITLQLPMALSHISAGFPSPADDHLENSLDLNQLLIQRPSATFFVRVTGDSMQGAGICSGDILIVDRAQEPRSNDIVLAILCGEFTVKRWIRTRKSQILQAENPDFSPIEITAGLDFEIWGVVTYAIHTLSV